MALKSDGTVVGWGFDDYGRYDVPAGLSNVVAVVAGQFHTLALVSEPVKAKTGLILMLRGAAEQPAYP